MPPKHYGLISELDVQREDRATVIELTGLTQTTGQRFYKLLSKRATYLLWYQLTQMLYPDDAPTMTSSAGTAPLKMPDGQVITAYVRMTRVESWKYELVGGSQADDWAIEISEGDAHRLWGTLDVLLFPVGWQGREGGAAGV